MSFCHRNLYKYTYMQALLFASAFLLVEQACTDAADLVTLNQYNWKRFAPRGKEVDAIYGDYVLRNDHLIAVIAKPVLGRHANMQVRNVGGTIIDLTTRDNPSDQLCAFYPGNQKFSFRFKEVTALGSRIRPAQNPDSLRVAADSITLFCYAQAPVDLPAVDLSYTITDGNSYVLVETVYTNTGTSSLSFTLEDAVRAERTFEKSPDGPHDLFWVFDKWFEQAYGVIDQNHAINSNSNSRNSILRYENTSGKHFHLQPGKHYRQSRYIFPAKNLFDAKHTARSIQGHHDPLVEIAVKDASGDPIDHADVLVNSEDFNLPYANGRTQEKGVLRFRLPTGIHRVKISALGHGKNEWPLKIKANTSFSRHVFQLPNSGYVRGRIRDQSRRAVPCKIEFRGTSGTPNPDFGPDSGDYLVGNVTYAPKGRFHHKIPPGTYDVIISHGPEFDAIFTSITVRAGETTLLKGKLIRSVNTTGWISSDFHSHSSPSGDNTSSQLGRVLNLVCEHIEFAPCTEHNRISTYANHIDRLGIDDFISTCSGMELTHVPGTVNHQNAFPLDRSPHTQDGGAPVRDDDPEIQIERLALWDDNSEKLVQTNHPDIGHLFFDKNGDGLPDKGYRKMFAYMDAMEVHPPEFILDRVPLPAPGRDRRIFHWLQLLNQGYRIPGTVNTDAHYNFHGSGWLRNYIRSDTDDPDDIETGEVVRAAENGQMVLTNGPFLEVTLRQRAQNRNDQTVGPGEDFLLLDGQGLLHVRVQCPNWFDIDRVQILLNGRLDPRLNFTRANTPQRFQSSTVKFDQNIPISVDRDTHIIVVAIGEHLRLGPVVGSAHQNTRPVAVSNPIWVDVDGKGFAPNKDTLGSPLPVKQP